MGSLVRLVAVLGGGGLAGLAALGIDELAAWLTAGYPVVVSLRQAAVYPVAGAVAAGLVEGGLRLARRPPLQGLGLVAATLAVLAV